MSKKHREDSAADQRPIRRPARTTNVATGNATVGKQVGDTNVASGNATVGSQIGRAGRRVVIADGDGWDW